MASGSAPVAASQLPILAPAVAKSVTSLDTARAARARSTSGAGWAVLGGRAVAWRRSSRRCDWGRAERQPAAAASRSALGFGAQGLYGLTEVRGAR